MFSLLGDFLFFEQCLLKTLINNNISINPQTKINFYSNDYLLTYTLVFTRSIT
ncbi:hypothetical protein ALTERO38_50972 [Alteromonas sp. 38]|nr:hypothetical protein ALTER154_70154 [Alteromonas sp. 154]VXB55360.1 hypothetical protein ALTERO38_50972 [Alteromonas sp. 38]